MSEFTEKPRGHVESNEVDIVQTRVVRGHEAFHEALIKEPVSIFNRTTILLFLCSLMGFFAQTVNGFDSSLFGTLTGNKIFLGHFNGAADGIWAGLVSSMYQIGGIAALPFVGPAVDTFGRRVGMFIGSVIIIAGVVTTVTTVHHASVGQFEGGRFLLGFGCSIVTAAGPVYTVEVAHPANRSVLMGYLNAFWLCGSILAAGSIRGALNLTGNSQWTVPLWLQMFFPGLIVVCVCLVPESPRWLYVHGKTEQAKNMLTKWHGNGNPDSIWVKLELAEYEEYLELDGADKRWWDYRALFRDRASRYRILANCAFSIMAQWCGNGLLTYFFTAALETVGYTNTLTIDNFNLGYNVFQFAFALAGANFVERLGRRKLMLGAISGITVVWACQTAAAGVYNTSGDQNKSAAQATIAFIFLFGGIYSFGITPLQSLYPVELLSYEMRAKGMAFSSLAVNAGGMLNQYAWPVAIKKIGWKTYIVFIVWCAIQGVIWYFTMPETKGRTLEELDKIFEARNPVKASLEPRTLAITADNDVITKEELQ